MNQSVRDLFLSERVQSHLATIILNTLKAVVFVASKNENLNSTQRQIIQKEIAEAQGSDISVVGRIFRTRYEFTDSRNFVRQKSILSLCRNVKDNHEKFLMNFEGSKTENVKVLYNNLREIDPLVQTLVYYRNFCSHNMNLTVTKQFGWEIAIIASVVRTCEIALAQQHDKNAEIIEDFKSIAQCLFEAPTHDNAAITTVETDDVKSEPDNNNSRVDLTQINERLDNIVSNLKDLDDLNKKIDSLLNQNESHQLPALNLSSEESDPTVALNHSRNDSVEIIEEENDKEESYDELTTISPEILRQRLLEIGSKVKAQYQGAPGFGASTNLLQVANIGIILQNESKTLDEALAMEEILSRIDRNSPLIEEQILEYRYEIDDLLSNVLWQSAFVLDD